MSHSERQTDRELAIELQRELRRLEAERTHAMAKRDRANTIVESGDDSGHILITALADVRSLEQRIEQVSQVLADVQARR